MSGERIAGFWPPTTQAEVDERIAECLEGWPRSSSIDVEIIAWLSRELTTARVTANETGCELDGARYRIAELEKAQAAAIERENNRANE